MGWLVNQYLRRSGVYTSAGEYGGGAPEAVSPLPASYQDNSAPVFQDNSASLGVWTWQSLTRFLLGFVSPKVVNFNVWWH